MSDLYIINLSDYYAMFMLKAGGAGHFGLPPVEEEIRRVVRHGGGYPPVPAASFRDGGEHLPSQPHHDRLRFLFRVTLRRLDLAVEIYHIREPQKIPQVMSPDETRRGACWPLPL
jgi:hypothetical protein